MQCQYHFRVLMVQVDAADAHLTDRHAVGKSIRGAGPWMILNHSSFLALFSRFRIYFKMEKECETALTIT